MQENPLKPSVVTITAFKEETYDTKTYRFELEGFSFKPGQFNMVGLPGIGEAPFSFSSSPSQEWFEHTIKSVGRVTEAIARLDVGNKIFVRGPYGRGWPVERIEKNDILIVAGGIGMAPLRSFLLHAFENRNRFGRIIILYGARTPHDLLFQGEVPIWREQKDTEVLLTVDEVPPKVKWTEHRGVVTTLFNEVDKMGISPADTLVLTCGPEIMMRFVVVGLLQRGYPSSQIYLSLERRMRCGIAQCGHCQIGPKYVCLDGPVFPYPEIKGLADTLF
jgi:NAD(P)H-flavin reductase